MEQRRMFDRIEGIRSPALADDATLRMCDSERDAVLASIVMSRLTLEELGGRCGVSKQAVNAWSRNGVPQKRIRAFCNATGTRLLEQFLIRERAIRQAEGRGREMDRISAIVEHARRNAA